MFSTMINCPVCGYVEKLDAKNGVLALQSKQLSIPIISINQQMSIGNYQLDDAVDQRKQLVESDDGTQPPLHAPLVTIFPKATEEAEVFTINNNDSSFATYHVFYADGASEVPHQEIPSIEKEVPRIVEEEPSDDFTKFLLNEASNRAGPPSTPLFPTSRSPPTFGAAPVGNGASMYPALPVGVLPLTRFI